MWAWEVPKSQKDGHKKYHMQRCKNIECLETEGLGSVITSDRFLSTTKETEYQISVSAEAAEYTDCISAEG